MARFLEFCFASTILLSASSVSAAPLHDAVKNGDIAAVEALLVEGADVNEVDFLAGAPLHIAAVRGHDDVLATLLEADANADIVEWGREETPLHWAAFGGNSKSAKLLLEAGATVDAVNDKGETALMTALENGHRDVAELLIAEGADLQLQSDELATPMQLAGASEMFDIVEMMKARGAAPEEPAPVADLLASADPGSGKAVYASKCDACHGSLSPPEQPWLEFGPPLYGVFDRDIASLEDFDYSKALSRVEGAWTVEQLNRIITNASGFFPGTKMVTHARREIGVADPSDRADLITYLRVTPEG